MYSNTTKDRDRELRLKKIRKETSMRINKMKIKEKESQKSKIAKREEILKKRKEDRIELHKKYLRNGFDRKQSKDGRFVFYRSRGIEKDCADSKGANSVLRVMFERTRLGGFTTDK